MLFRSQSVGDDQHSSSFADSCHIGLYDALGFVVECAGGLVEDQDAGVAHQCPRNRNALFLGGVRPHYYCLPVLKREEHRLALLKAATQGGPQFFLGTDSAPHPAALKEHASGCAGCYTAHAAIEMYAEAFDSVDALDRLEAFASFHGPDFYGLPRNTSAITLERQDWRSPVTVPFGEAELKPLRGGEVLPWRLTS